MDRITYEVSKFHSVLKRSARAAMLPALLCMLAVLMAAQTSDAQGAYISSLTDNPSSVIGGANSTGTVTLSSSAGSGGQVINLSSNNSAATLPASVTVAQGQSSANFTITTIAVTSLQTVTITATTTVYYGYTSSRSMTLVVNPPGGGGGGSGISTLTLAPVSVVGGRPVQATVTLTAAAPTGGYAVTMSCSNNAAVALGTNNYYVVNVTPFPTTVTVPAGATSFSFYLNTSTINYIQTFTLTASNVDHTSSASATLTLLPANLHVTDYVLPKTMKLVWDSPTTQGYYTLVRSVMSGSPLSPGQSTIIAILPSGTMNFNDSYNFADGAIYLYGLYDTTATPPTADDLVANYPRLSADMVTPFANMVTENQTVDSRLDLRYSAVHYKDFKFGTRIYRGGLFAGFAPNPDQSQVARSFAKFLMSPAPANTSFRAGDINLYFTGSNTNLTNLPIGCQAITNNDWTSPNLVWTLAPVVTPGSATVTANLNWDKNNPAPKWTAWSLTTDICAAAVRAAAGGDARLSVAVGAPNETSGGWAYFAKQEYDATLAPTVTHLWDWAVPVKLFVCSTTVTPPLPAQPTTTWTFTVIVNGLNPGDTTGVGIGTQSGIGNTGVTVTSLINTFSGSYTGDLPPRIPYTATYNGITVRAVAYPGTSPCNGGYGGGGYP